MKESFFRLISRSTEKIVFEKNDDYKSPKDGISVKFNFHSKIINQKENTAEVSFTFTLFSKEDLENSPFFLSITEKGIFEWNEETEEDIVKKLLDINAPSILLSYMRSMISQITAFSGYPALIIPLINFNE